MNGRNRLCMQVSICAIVVCTGICDVDQSSFVTSYRAVYSKRIDKKYDRMEFVLQGYTAHHTPRI